MRSLSAVRKIAVLGLAGVGAQQLWKQYQGRAARAVDTTSQSIDAEVKPAVRDAARAAKSKSQEVVDKVVNTARSAAATMAEAPDPTDQIPAGADSEVGSIETPPLAPDGSIR